MKLEVSEVLDKLKEHKDAMPTVLLAASAILVVLVLVKVAGFFTTSTWAMNLASKASLVGRFSGDTAVQTEKSKETADALKKKNLFAPPTQKQNPVREVPGILGSKAFINGKWYDEGQNVGEAKVVSVEPTEVKIEWEGNEKSFLPIMANTNSGQQGPSRRPGETRPTSDNKSGERRPDVVVNVQGPGGPGGFRPGMDFSGMRERFMNMSEQEREAFRQRMRERFNGGGGPGGGFRGPGGGDFGGRSRGDFGGRGGPR